MGIRSPHFRIRLSQAVKEDLRVWQQFLAGFNERTIFLSEVWYNSNLLELFTDASGAVGFGAIFGRPLVLWRVADQLEASKYCNFGILSHRFEYPFVG